MAAAPLPPDEETRLAYLQELAVLDTAPEPTFDRFVELARHITGAPVAMVSLVAADRQWFKARAGTDLTETPREEAICAYAILDDEVMVVPDATADPRLADNPMVVGGPGVRFYAGAPLITRGGNLGALCVIDFEPRTLTDDQRSALAALAGAAAHQLEQRLLARRAQRHLRWLHLAEELGNIGHWRVVASDRSVFWSPEVYAIHGRDPATFVPDLPAAIEAYHPDDRDVVRELVHAALEDGTPYEFERRLVRPSGEIRWVRSIGRPEIGPDGEVTSVFGVFNDVTDQKLLQSEVLHRETLSSLGLMAATMAHEINNPLASMQLNAEALSEFLDGMGSDADARMALADLDDAIGRVRQLTDELRSVARPASLGRARVELPRVVDAALRMVGFRLDEARVETDLDGLPTVHSNESKCVQVMMNLLVNAADAMADTPRPAKLVIRGGATVDRVWLEVADNGTGMPPAVAARAFEPFFTSKGPGQGTGLGLYVCRQAIESLGGAIALDSTEGEGTTVRIELPRHEPADAADSPSAARQPRTAASGRRVLVIDDNAMVGRALQRALRNRGAETEPDPARALERLLREGEHYGAIVCDLAMPVLSGPELYERVVAVRPELAERFLFITGGTPYGEAHSFMEKHQHRVFVKPLDMSSLTAAIDALL